MIVTLDVQNQEVLTVLQSLFASITHPKPALVAVGQELKTRVSDRFQSQTNPAGHAWATWAPSTVKSYPKDGHHKVLDRYGDMLASLNWQADNTQVQIGFGTPYAAYHEWGTQTMPRRGLLTEDPDAGQLSQSDETAVLEILMSFFDSVVG